MGPIFQAIQSLESLTVNINNIMDKNIIIFCVGTPRCLMDSIGPSIGTKLIQLGYQGIVYGTEENPVHALNIKDKIQEVKNKYPDHKILAIDASITKNKNKVGVIEFKNEPVYPGAGAMKTLPPIGDYSIKVIVTTQDMFTIYGDINHDSEMLIKYMINKISNILVSANKKVI